jgi:hypothetical protein
MRTLRLFILVTAAALVGGLTLAFLHYTQDDVYITYTYSRHLAEGVGFVFNPGERVQGTTTPLWTLVMAVVHWLTPAIREAGNLLSGGCLLGTGALVFRLTRRCSSYAVAAIGLLLVVTSPLAYVSFGMETPLYCLILFGAFALWADNRRIGAFALAGLLTWTRADGVVLCGALGLAALIEDRRLPLPALIGRLAWYVGVYLLVIAPWFVFAQLYFGALLPNTFSAKQELFSGVAYLSRGGAWWHSFYGSNPISLIALVTVPVGAWQAWRLPVLRPLLIWVIAYVAGYTALNVTNFWYYLPPTVALTVLTVLGAHTLLRRVAAPISARRWVKWGAIAMAALAIGLNVMRAAELRDAPPRMNTYELIGKWINDNTPADYTLLVADLGVAGYHARRHTIDSFGLIVPRLTTRAPDLLVHSAQPDMVLATSYFFWEFVGQDWFTSQYLPVVAISTEGDAEFSPMTLYMRRDRFTPPPQESFIFEIAPQWADWCRLPGSAVDSAAWSGGQATLTVAWEALRPSAQAYTLFVHLLDAEGRIAAQADGPPPVPTSAWQAGQRIEDRRVLRLPPTLQSGDFSVRIGWYTGNQRVLLSTGMDYVDLPGRIRVTFPGGNGLP